MHLLRVLLAKDLRRAWRNPLPWMINLIVPLAMTALIGLVFGGSSNGGALGKIRFAVVDEDKSVVSKFLRGSANQEQGGKYLEPVIMEREAAMREINANKISAVFIIPTNFTRNYLLGRGNISLELIKNPAESIHPAVLEEGLGAIVTALNAISRNFQSEFPELQAVVDGQEDYHKVAELIDRAGDKLKQVKKYVDPPLVSYTKESPGDKAVPAADGAAKKTDPGNGIFAYLLIGMSGMFLLFIAGNASNDIYRELRLRTFERYQTMRVSLVPFLTGKAVFTIVMLMLCSVTMLGGGGLIFRVHWEHPFELMALALGYACFAAAFYSVLVALMPDERRAAVMSSLAGLGLGMLGGCAFPPQQLPAFLRRFVTPHLPSYWFASTMRDLQSDAATVAWGLAALKLAATGAVLLVLAAALFKRKFKSGLRA